MLVRPALLALGFTAAAACASAPPSEKLEPPAARPSAAAPAGQVLGELLGEYRAYGLPLPPEDAALVRFQIGRDSGGPVYHLAFAGLAGGTPAREVLLGTRLYRVRDGVTVERVAPEVGAAEQVLTASVLEPFPLNLGLATAIQCKARGWDALGERLLAASLSQGAGGFAETFLQRPNAPPLEALTAMAAAHWGAALADPRSDRAAILAWLDALVATGRLRAPSLGADFPDAEHRLVPLLEALRETIAVHPVHTGMEAMIDALTESAMRRSLMTGNEEDARYLALADRGFDAVPALIAHLGDSRLSRSYRLGFNNFPTRMLAVGDLASDLLQELAGDELGKDWLRRQQGYGVAKKDAEAWWAAARSAGEEAYLVGHVIPAAADAKAPNLRVLRLLSRRFPARLPEVYTNLLRRRPELVSDHAAKAIAESGLGTEHKIAALAAAAEDPSFSHRRGALRALLSLDPARFVRLLVKALDALPPTPSEPYWRSPEAAFANLALETADAAVWRALVRAAKRADVGLRMELLKPMASTYIEDRQRAQRLHFLLQWLDDSALREAKEGDPRWEGPFAGFTVRRITVGDFAARELASILELPLQDHAPWSEAERGEVRAAAEKEIGRLGGKPF
jgi:hypothetical protein